MAETTKRTIVFELKADDKASGVIAAAGAKVRRSLAQYELAPTAREQAARAAPQQYEAYARAQARETARMRSYGATIEGPASVRDVLGSSRSMRAVMGGGIVGFVGHELAAATSQLEKFVELSRQGETHWAGIVQELLKATPIIGGFAQAGENINNILTGSKSKRDWMTGADAVIGRTGDARNEMAARSRRTRLGFEAAVREAARNQSLYGMTAAEREGAAVRFAAEDKVTALGREADEAKEDVRKRFVKERKEIIDALNKAQAIGPEKGKFEREEEWHARLQKEEQLKQNLIALRATEQAELNKIDADGAKARADIAIDSAQRIKEITQKANREILERIGEHQTQLENTERRAAMEGESVRGDMRIRQLREDGRGADAEIEQIRESQRAQLAEIARGLEERQAVYAVAKAKRERLEYEGAKKADIESAQLAEESAQRELDSAQRIADARRGIISGDATQRERIARQQAGRQAAGEMFGTLTGFLSGQGEMGRRAAEDLQIRERFIETEKQLRDLSKNESLPQALRDQATAAIARLPEEQRLAELDAQRRRRGPLNVYAQATEGRGYTGVYDSIAEQTKIADESADYQKRTAKAAEENAKAGQELLRLLGQYLQNQSPPAGAI